MSYRGYLKNNTHWKELRRLALEKSKEMNHSNNTYGSCMQCGYEPWKPILQLHHLNYDNKGYETLEDVILLCPNCHKNIHKINQS